MLAVPRTAKPLSWHGKQLAEMQLSLREELAAELEEQRVAVLEEQALSREAAAPRCAAHT